MKKKFRPQSYSKFQKNKNHIPINCFRASSSIKDPYNNPNFKGIFNNGNKNYTISPNSYVDKYKSQLKRLNMYNEMWNNSLSEEEDFYGISETIKIQPENKKCDYSMNTDKLRVNSTNTRISSATTYNDIGYKSKRLIKGIESNLNTINFNSIEKNSIKHKINKIRTNTIINDIKDNYLNTLSYYNNTMPNRNQNYVDTNSSNNLNNSSTLQNYKSNNKDLKTKEGDIISKNENKKTLDIEDKESLKKAINDCNETTLKLRTDYLIKLSKLLDMCKKFEQFSDCFRVERREIFSQSMKNFTRSFDKCNDFILNGIKTGEIFDLNIFVKNLVLYYNFTLNLIKYQKNVFKEMHFLKTENMNLKKRAFLIEGELTTKIKDINEINKFIVQYDLTNKVKYGKQKELSIQEVKEKYMSKESAYVLTIYKLEEEIKHLTNVLEKNRYNVNNFQEVSKKLKQVQQNYENDKYILVHQNDDKDITINILNQTIADLNDRIKDMESEIQQLKDKAEKVEHNYIQYEAKIKNLNDIIQNKNNNIDELEKENKTFKEKKSTDNKMLKPIETIFIPTRDKLRKRKKNK